MVRRRERARVPAEAGMRMDMFTYSCIEECVIVD